MRSFLMAGGEAKRAWPYSTFIEKSLLKLGGKPVVRIISDRILKAGPPPNLFNSFEMVLCILGQNLDDFRWEYRDVRDVKFSPKMDAVGTASHYYYAAEQEFHVGPDEWVLLHYADCLTEIDYAEFAAFALNSGKPACIAVTANAQHDYSEVEVKDGVVIKLKEKPTLSTPTWTGIACFQHKAIKQIFGDTVLFGRKVDFAIDVWPKLVEQKALAAYLYPGQWKDTGNTVSYNRLREEFARGNLYV